jgi:hypothetical protein
MDDGIRPVTDGPTRDVLWRRAKGIHGRSAAAAIVLAIVGMVL